MSKRETTGAELIVQRDAQKSVANCGAPDLAWRLSALLEKSARVYSEQARAALLTCRSKAHGRVASHSPSPSATAAPNCVVFQVAPALFRARLFAVTEKHSSVGCSDHEPAVGSRPAPYFAQTIVGSWLPATRKFAVPVELLDAVAVRGNVGRAANVRDRAHAVAFAAVCYHGANRAKREFVRDSVKPADRWTCQSKRVPSCLR